MRELEFTPSFTIEKMSVNPWKSGFMDVGEDFRVTDSGSPLAPASSSSSKTVVMVKNGKIMIR